MNDLIERLKTARAFAKSSNKHVADAWKMSVYDHLDEIIEELERSELEKEALRARAGDQPAFPNCRVEVAALYNRIEDLEAHVARIEKWPVHVRDVTLAASWDDVRLFVMQQIAEAMGRELA